MQKITDLASRILSGDVAAAAKLITEIENETPQAVEEIKKLYPCTGKAYVVGITGAPGVGKSTLVDRLAGILRTRNMTVGIIAIDPSSLFTGGALLGDRVRMREVGLDEGVFIRSLATKGQLGGLSRATIGTVHVMDAMGKDIVLIETAGIGQAEIDIVSIADTSVIILTPDMGDEVQTMKAGILEVADVFVVNKADKAGGKEVRGEMQAMLGAKNYLLDGWAPNVVETEAISGEGTEELVQEILRHKEFITSANKSGERGKQRARFELFENVEEALKNYIYEHMSDKDNEELIGKLARREIDPFSAASQVIERFIKK